MKYISSSPLTSTYWVIICLTCVPVAFSTYRYYSLYLAYGSGDTMVQTFHAHGGSTAHNRKWLCECQDGEAMVGIQDFSDDFGQLRAVWCRFMFPNKPASQGVYPYYPICHVKNYRLNPFCFDAQNASRTINTFVTGLWDSDPNFYLYRTPGTGFFADDLQPYKCCKTPEGYYIDYVSCYYMSTHDIYFEYYDSPYQIVVACSTGFVITGVSKKINPYTTEYNLDWIQCCRVGYGPPAAQSPPVYNSDNSMPAYTGSIAPVAVPSAYRSQYRMMPDDQNAGLAYIKDRDLKYTNNTKNGHWNVHYSKQPKLRKSAQSAAQQPLLGAFQAGNSLSRY